MMKLLLLGLLCISWLFSGEGEAVYQKKCAACHSTFIPMGELKENFMDQNNTLLHLKAPTLNQLSFRLKQQIGDSKGDPELHLMEVSAFISDYLMAPNKEKSVCLPEVIRYFETMPSMKGKITQEEMDAVSEFIYNYDDMMVNANSVSYKAFDQAVEQANKEHKIIMVKATAEHCHYCKKMDREVMTEKEVLEALNKDFVSVEVDVSDAKLPLGLEAKVTPAFFFIDEKQKVIKTIPGSWNKEDFLEILKEAKAAKREEK